MSDLKLFNISGNNVSQLEAKSVELERSLQSLMEQNLETLLGVTFWLLNTQLGLSMEDGLIRSALTRTTAL